MEKSLKILLVACGVLLLGIFVPLAHSILYPLNEYLWDGVQAATEEPFGSIFITGNVINGKNEFVKKCAKQYKEVNLRPYTIFMIPGKIVFACAATDSKGVIIGVSSAGFAERVK